MTSLSSPCGWTLNFRGLASWKWLEASCSIIKIRYKSRLSHHVHPKRIGVCDWANHIYKELPIGSFRIPGCCWQITNQDHESTVVLPILPCWYPLISPFLCITVYHQILCSPEWFIIENRLPIYYEPPIIMTPQILRLQQIICLSKYGFPYL